MLAGVLVSWESALQLSSIVLWFGWHCQRNYLTLPPIVDGKHFGSLVSSLLFF
jgi:hypothetical protein